MGNGEAVMVGVGLRVVEACAVDVADILTA